MRASSLVSFSVCALAVAALFPRGDQVRAAAAGSVWPYQVTQQATGDIVNARLVRLATGDEPATLVVSQKNKAFEPTTAGLRVGQAMEIVNDDTTIHNAYCQSGDFKYNSGPQQPGSRSRLVFTAPGTYEVRCAIHPRMKLTVTVAE